MNAQVVINDSFATNVFDGLTDATGGIGTQTLLNTRKTEPSTGE